MENKYCPLMKCDCMKNCAWYVVGLNGCSVNVLAQAIDSQIDAIEDFVDSD